MSDHNRIKLKKKTDNKYWDMDMVCYRTDFVSSIAETESCCCFSC